MDDKFLADEMYYLTIRDNFVEATIHSVRCIGGGAGTIRQEVKTGPAEADC